MIAQACNADYHHEIHQFFGFCAGALIAVGVGMIVCVLIDLWRGR